MHSPVNPVKHACNITHAFGRFYCGFHVLLLKQSTHTYKPRKDHISGFIRVRAGDCLCSAIPGSVNMGSLNICECVKYEGKRARVAALVVTIWKPLVVGRSHAHMASESWYQCYCGSHNVARHIFFVVLHAAGWTGVAYVITFGRTDRQGLNALLSWMWRSEKQNTSSQKYIALEIQPAGFYLMQICIQIHEIDKCESDE